MSDIQLEFLASESNQQSSTYIPHSTSWIFVDPVSSLSSRPTKHQKKMADPPSKSRCSSSSRNHRRLLQLHLNALLYPLRAQHLLQQVGRGPTRLRLKRLTNAKLAISPQRSNVGSSRVTDANEAALGGPIALAPNVQLAPHGIERGDQVGAELARVAWGRRDAQTLLADGNSGVVDGLYVDAPVEQEAVTGLLC